MNESDAFLRRVAISDLLGDYRIAYNPDDLSTKKESDARYRRFWYACAKIAAFGGIVGAVLASGAAAGWFVALGVFGTVAYLVMSDMRPEDRISDKLKWYRDHPIDKLCAVRKSVNRDFRTSLETFGKGTSYADLCEKRNQAVELGHDWESRARKAGSEYDKLHYQRRNQAAAAIAEYLEDVLAPLEEAKASIEQAQEQAGPYLRRLDDAIAELQDENKHQRLAAFVGSGGALQQAYHVLQSISATLAHLDGLVEQAQLAHQQAQLELMTPDRSADSIAARILAIEQTAQATA